MSTCISQRLQIGQLPAFKLHAEEHELCFKHAINTSRGVLHHMKVYLIDCETDLGHGVGECCPMPMLSPEYSDSMLERVQEACAMVEAKGGLEPTDFARESSIRFGIEGALLSSLRFPIWDNPYTRGEQGIPLHHLVWMGDHDAMRVQIRRGVQAGFRCIKLKVATKTWADDLALLQEVRDENPQLEIRVDANGDFKPDEALDRLEELSRIGISCIEQPIAPRQWDAMAKIVEQAPMRIALDEELLYCYSFAQRELMLRNIKPHALVIKPSLHGGFQATEEYLKLAQQLRCACWLNSSLESNVGLDLLAQWAGEYMPDSIQALGTGQLYTQNFNASTQFFANELRFH